MSTSQRSGYRGVRSRDWGRWVTEVRQPGTDRRRIWLGSYRSAEEAAHAYDAGLLCVGGNINKLNFPNDRPTLPPGTPGNYTIKEVQGAAQMAAAAYAGRSFSFSDWMRSPSSPASTDDNTAQAGGSNSDYPINSQPPTPNRDPPSPEVQGTTNPTNQLWDYHF